MADQDNKSYSTDDEFKFSPDTTSEVESNAFSSEPSSKQLSNPFNNVNKQNLLILLGTIIMLFAVYKLSSLFFSAEKKIKAEVTGKSEVIKAELKPASMPVQVPVSQVPSPVAAPTPAQPMTSTAIDNLQNQYNTLQNQVASLATSVSNLQESISSMNDEINSVKNLMSQQKESLEKLQNPPKKVVKPVKKKVIPKIHYVYTIQAIIPGRAWLVDNFGQNLSVTEGQKLPGYGRIKLINPVTGKVITSTGAIISYGKF